MIIYANIYNARPKLINGRTVIIISYLWFNMHAIFSEHRALIDLSVMSKIDRVMFEEIYSY